MGDPAKRRRILTRLALQALAAGMAVALTLALAGHSANGAFTARTGSSASSATASGNFCAMAGQSETLIATADTSGYQNNPAATYGSYADLGAISELGGNARALLRFGLPTRSHCTLTEATLRLYANNPDGGRTIQVLRVDPATPWSEAATVWNTMPSVVAGTAVDSPSRNSVGWQEWTVTSIVTSHYAGTNSGFLVRDSAEGAASPGFWQLYDSRSKTNKPELVLTWG
jgi:hypothetical protein